MVEHSAVNRNVGGSNPPRGANSLFMQRVANIFRKLCPLAMKCQVHESRLISINEDEGKSTRAGVSEVDQINRGQPRSIALKPSIRLETECSPVSRWGARLPAKQVCYLQPLVSISSEWTDRSHSGSMRSNRSARRRFGKPPNRRPRRVRLCSHAAK